MKKNSKIFETFEKLLRNLYKAFKSLQNAFKTLSKAFKNIKTRLKSIQKGLLEAIQWPFGGLGRGSPSPPLGERGDRLGVMRITFFEQKDDLIRPLRALYIRPLRAL